MHTAKYRRFSSFCRITEHTAESNGEASLRNTRNTPVLPVRADLVQNLQTAFSRIPCLMRLLDRTRFRRVERMSMKFLSYGLAFPAPIEHAGKTIIVERRSGRSGLDQMNELLPGLHVSEESAGKSRGRRTRAQIGRASCRERV